MPRIKNVEKMVKAKPSKVEKVIAKKVKKNVEVDKPVKAKAVKGEVKTKKSKDEPTPTKKQKTALVKRPPTKSKEAKNGKAEEKVKAKRSKPGDDLVDGQSWYRTNDLPWCDKKVSIIKYLKQKKAVTPDKARSSNDIAEGAGVSGKDARHYCYHGKAGGYVDIVTDAKGRGYLFYLTDKGKSCDPAKEFKAQEKAKKS